MGTKKQSVDEQLPESKSGEPSSATRPKSAPETLELLVADFKTRARGLEGPALEDEIERLMQRLIEKSARLAPEPQRPELRKFLRAQLEADPTLQGMLGDLRRAARRG